MRGLGLSAVMAGLVVSAAPEFVQPRLDDGVISYVGTDGIRRKVNTGTRCADLWTAPDESAFTFVSLDRIRGPDSYGQMFVEASSIYVALREEGYVPRRLAIKPIRLYGRDWDVFLKPKFLQGDDSVVFSIPTSVTSSDLAAFDMRTNQSTAIESGVIDYCAVWNNEEEERLLAQRRQIIDLNLRYTCYSMSHGGRQGRLVAERCNDFAAFVAQWSRAHNNRRCY